MDTSYFATIYPETLNFSILEGDEEVANHSVPITEDQYNSLMAGTLASDAFPVPGWTLDEREINGDSRFGYATKAA